MAEMDHHDPIPSVEYDDDDLSGLTQSELSDGEIADIDEPPARRPPRPPERPVNMRLTSGPSEEQLAYRHALLRNGESSTAKYINYLIDLTY
jgi:hypothetical protein